MSVDSEWAQPPENVWPFDGPDTVFLGRAVNAIGQAMFGEAWTGQEFGARAPAPLPGINGIWRSEDIARAVALLSGHELLAKHAPAVLAVTMVRTAAPVPPPTARSPRPAPEVEPRLNMAQWLPYKEAAEAGVTREIIQAAALEALERQREELAPLIGRAVEVERAFTAACVSQRLTTYYLWSDGKYYHCSNNPHDVGGWWNVSVAKRWPRFRTFKVDRLNPILDTKPKAATDPCWIFVSRASLEGYLSDLRGERGSAAPWHRQGTESLEEWCNRAEVVAEATARAKHALSSNPSDKDLCKVLARLWEIATGERRTPGTVEQYRVKARNRARLAE